MKILLATYWAVPHTGGVWEYMCQLARKLEEFGHTVDLLGYSEDNSRVHIHNDGRSIGKKELLPLLEAHITKEHYPAIFANELVRYTEFQRYVYELGAAYLGLDQYDIIHTQDVISSACLDRVRPSHVPMIATLHGSVAYSIYHQLETIHQSDTDFMARAYYDELERIGATAADKTIVANHWLKDLLIDEFNVPDSQLDVLHYGYDTHGYLQRTKGEPPLTPPDDKLVILFTGRLVENKGVQHLLRALAGLKEIRTDWVAWIVGDGEYEQPLLALQHELGLDDDVYFLGERTDIPVIVSQCDIFVYPSLLENQPLSVIEAQLSGKAIIASDAGGLPEMIEDGVTGLIYPKDDVEKLSQKLDYLIEHPNTRMRLGQNARKWGMAHWAFDRGVHQLLNRYKTVIRQRKTPR